VVSLTRRVRAEFRGLLSKTLTVSCHERNEGGDEGRYIGRAILMSDEGVLAGAQSKQSSITAIPNLQIYLPIFPAISLSSVYR
jgi:hypothetical protein